MTVTNRMGNSAGGEVRRSEGLGLTIVRAITDRFDARFEFRYPGMEPCRPSSSGRRAEGILYHIRSSGISKPA